MPLNICLSTHQRANAINDVMMAIATGGHTVFHGIKSISDITFLARGIDLIFSDRTEFLFPNDFIKSGPRIINTHLSLLPQHRGSQSLFFCTLLGDAHGVSIHEVDEGIDTGNVIWQHAVDYRETDTFREIHQRSRFILLRGITELSNISFPLGVPHRDSLANTKCHRVRDFSPLFALLPLGWDTQVGDARGILGGKLKDLSIDSRLTR